MEEGDRWIGPVLPLDDVDSGDIDLAGRLAELLDRVDVAVRALEQQRTVAQWSELLADLVLTLGAPAQTWQAVQLRGELADLAEAAGESDVQLTRADIAALLADRLAGRPSRASFRTGTLTVCTLVPMRSVPHRVVCLVGMDDGAFPRHGLVDGDDVLARDPRIGERDVRSEDRQLFLDAICAAQEHLVITYTGADPRSGAEVPPCVPLGELLDAVDASATAPDGRPGREHVLIRHPLQPFDARNFVAGQLGADGPFSFDPAGLAGARAAAGERRAVPPLVAQALGPVSADTVELDDLVRFVQHPARAFLRQRLGISTYDEDDDPADALPVELDGLQSWVIGERVLRNCLAGMSRETCVEIERRRGELPPGPLGRAQLRTIGTNVDALLAACQVERATPSRSVDVSVRLDDGRRLSGTVGGVRGAAVLSVGYSTLAGKHRLAAWVRHVALVASLGDAALQSVTVGRRRGGARRSILHGVDPAGARRVLNSLVALRDAGLRAPLPMAAGTSQAYAERRHRGDSAGDALAAARTEWEASRFSNENAEPEHVLVFGAKVSLDALTSEPDESRPDEPTRFGALARRLWTALLDAETDVRA
jgi:exodeoxyribonuclease V gamma subunit